MGGKTRYSRPVVHRDKGKYLSLFLSFFCIDQDDQFTTNFKRGNDAIAQKVLYVGNGNKSLHMSVKASLKKLRTSYIDLLYVHWWDFQTSVEEVMRSLHALVMAGKVLYIVSHSSLRCDTTTDVITQGISDTPAWVVSKANQYARDHGMTPFSVYQGAWNVMDRDFEREIIPMARSEGLQNYLISACHQY
jgi:aryl-alcohol dehydrogenase-like predicted oxidoreductase